MKVLTAVAKKADVNVVTHSHQPKTVANKA